MTDGRFSTADLYLAAALAAHFPLERIERQEQRAYFFFQESDALGAAVRRYYAGQYSVDARTYADSIRALKSALHAPGLARPR